MGRLWLTRLSTVRVYRRLRTAAAVALGCGVAAAVAQADSSPGAGSAFDQAKQSQDVGSVSCGASGKVWSAASSGQCGLNTELTPVPKDGALFGWSQVAGAVFPSTISPVAGSWCAVVIWASEAEPDPLQASSGSWGRTRPATDIRCARRTSHPACPRSRSRWGPGPGGQPPRGHRTTDRPPQRSAPASGDGAQALRAGRRG
jgi:hypothetical protein